MTEDQSEIQSRLIDIKSCARCGEVHAGVEFFKFKNSILFSYEVGHGNIDRCTTYGWWAMCPKLEEPIIMGIEETTESQEEKS